MGFGILFLGYMLTLNIEVKGVELPPDFLGFLLMIYAVRKLRDYSPNFKRTEYVLYPLLVFSSLSFIFDMTGYLGYYEFPYIGELGMLRVLFSLFMHYYLLTALADISHEVGRTKITRKCKRNIYISEIGILLRLILYIPISFPYKGLLEFILGYIVLNLIVVLNAIQIFSCYMWICYEGDEDMDDDVKTDPLYKMIKKTKEENAEYKKQKNQSKNKKGKK